VTLELVPWKGSRVPVLQQGEISRYSTADYINWLSGSQGYMGGPPPVQTTYGKNPVEPISNSFEGFVYGMLYVDGPVAAVEAYRLRVFGQAPLLYQDIVDGRAGDLFDDLALDRLRSPWAGATLSDLMKRALIYADFGGNAFIADLEDELVLLRPDWVEIVLEKRMHRGQQVGWKQIGIVYYEGGRGRDNGVPFLPGEYAHFIPGLPDPLASYRGMSWLTPLVREVKADKAAGDHKVAFFENSASPNLAVSLPKEILPSQFKEFVELMDSKHRGVENAGKTLYTGGGADVTVIGANMQQQDFASVVGKGETRIANAAGVSPVLLSFSEGMQGSSLNAGNYTPAKRNFVDTTMRDLWGNFAGSIGQMDAFKAPKANARLWYDGRDIPFLHEDAKDLAEIQQTRSATLNSYVTNGWKPETAIEAVAQDDITLLKHTGAFSVQLQPPGAQAQMTPDANGNGIADDNLPSGDGSGPDFGALRADFWEIDEEDVLRAVEDLFELDEDDLERARYDVRVDSGHVGGGRFRKLSDIAAALMHDWSKGDGPDDPLDRFDGPQLRRILADERKKALDAGDNERAARLTPRRGATPEQLKAALYSDVRSAVRKDRDSREKPSATFTLEGKAHRDVDAAVFKDSQGRPHLFEVSEKGDRGSLVEKFDSLDEMAAWGDEHGEPKLAAWARKESAAKTPAKKAPARKAPAKKAAPAAARTPEDVDTELRDAKPEDRRAILEEAAGNQTQARRLASQLGVKGASKLSRDEALDRIEAHYGSGKPDVAAVKAAPAKAARKAAPRKAAPVAPASPAVGPAGATSALATGHGAVLAASVTPDAFRAMSKEGRLEKLREVAAAAGSDPLVRGNARGWGRAVLAPLSVDELRELVDDLADISNWGTSEKRNRTDLAQAVMNLTGLNPEGRVDTADGPTSFAERQARVAPSARSESPAAIPGELGIPAAVPQTGHVAKDAQARAGWSRGDILTHRNKGKVRYIEPDEQDANGMGSPSGAQWVEFLDQQSPPGMVSADLLSGYVPPPKQPQVAAPRRIEKPAGPALPNVKTGDTATWAVPGEEPVVGRVTRRGDKITVKWATGRTEELEADRLDDLSFSPAAVPGKKAVPRKPAAKTSAAPQFDLERAMAEQGVSEAEIAEIRDLIRVERPRIVIGNELDDDIAAQMLFSREPRLKAFFDSHRAIYNHLVKEDKDKRTWTDQYAGQASEMQAKATRALRRAVAPGKPIVVRHGSESTLREILTSGRMKSQHETGTSSGGYIDKALRADYEEMAFGLPHDLPAAQRPIYGYVAPRGLAGDHGGKLDQYGDIRVVLRDSVRPRTTVSAGDSLDRRAELTPMPIDAPDWHAAQPAAAKYTDLGDQGFQDLTYVEAQIHGGVKTGDIQEVVFGHDPEPATVAALDGAGVSWRVEAPGKASTALKEAPKTSPADFLSRFDAATRAGLSPADAQAFTDSGMSLDEWRASRAEIADEDDILRADDLDEEAEDVDAPEVT
jgi:hypothetical protein